MTDYDSSEGNRLYLVCQGHLDVSDAILLGSRMKSAYHAASERTAMNKWFDKHKECCLGSPDHYQLAHNYSPNHDHPKVVEETPVAEGVKLALVKS